MAKRLLSGITPSSPKGLHLGNYFGAVKSHIAFQKENECFYFVANMHGLNTVFDPAVLEQNTYNIFIEYLAFGIDPEKTTFFVESDIPGIPYLQTIINNAVTVSELKRMHAYKDKIQNDVSQDAIGFGLFSYPVLMAADILLFSPDIVPVGEDQAQHVEICREIANTFNNRYGDLLKVPELSIEKETARVVGTDGKRKMSKSLGNDISIFAEEDVIKQQIMQITTDPARIRPTDPGNPQKNICFQYLKLLHHDDMKPDDEPTVSDMEDQYRRGKIGDVTIKKLLLKDFLEYFAPYRKAKSELVQKKEFVEEIRKQGALRANKEAEKTLERVRKGIGI